MRERLPGLLAEPLDFYDEFLRDRPRRRRPAVRWRLTHGGWFEDAAWPPAGVETFVWHLSSPEDRSASHDARRPQDGGLSARAETAAKWVRWTHDPESLVRSAASMPGYFLLADPPDDRCAAERPDVLSFTSGPLREPLDVAGPVLALLRLDSSCASMHVVARLLDLLPDGRLRRICDGAAAVDPVDGDAFTVVDLGSVGYRLMPGHRLTLQVASSDFPRYLPHPGTDEDPWSATSTQQNLQRIRVGGAGGSRVSMLVHPRPLAGGAGA